MGTAASLSLRTSILRLVRACQKDGCTMDEKGWNWIMGISCACRRERYGARWMNDESTDKSPQEARSRAPTRYLLFIFSDDCWNIPCHLPERILITPTGRDRLGCLSTSNYEVKSQPSERPHHIFCGSANIPSKIQETSFPRHQS